MIGHLLYLPVDDFLPVVFAEENDGESLLHLACLLQGQHLRRSKSGEGYGMREGAVTPVSTNEGELFPRSAQKQPKDPRYK